ncbi:acyltransferase [Pseudescherichia sp.]|uniref:acyltransferase n=1 Tax=Pseudescherichia sp. TaxID=2055881 RepID=UPI002896FC45|nr:acyltransferase family protein [Pseudescherichia sp.]
MQPLNANLTRAIAIALVVMLHMSANSFASYGENWWISLTYDSLTRACVPLFFMLSGALLLQKIEPAAIFYRKRVAKILIPLIFWSYVYLLYRKYYVGESELSLSPLMLLNGPVYYHLWFLYSIIAVYLFIPMLRFYAINATNSVKLLVLALWFVSQSIQPFAAILGWNLYTGIDLGFVSRFFGFVLLGEYLASNRYMLNKATLLTIFTVSTLLTLIFTYHSSSQSGAANEVWFQYHSPFVITAAIALFLLCMNAKTQLPALFEPVSTYSFGIYFVHIIIMQQLSVRFIFKPEYFNSALSIILIPLAFCVSMLVSTLICIAFSKIPGLRKTV